jgi:helicase
MTLQELRIHNIPDRTLQHFEAIGIKELTKVQEAAVKAGITQGKSLLISSPTSSGKTFIAELAIISQLAQGHSAAYLVSHKALAEQKYDDFKRRYADPDDPLFSVAIAIGDWVTEQTLFGPSRLLISTYEKFFSLLTDFPNVLKNLNLLIADEIQLLSDDTRGSTVEIICTLLKKQPKHQFIGLSACIPNSNDLADWLGCRCVEVKNRDVPLRQEAWDDRNIFVTTLGNDEEYAKRENPIGSMDTLEIVKWCLQNNLGPILVFTMTKSRAVSLAGELKRVEKKGVKVERSNLQNQLRLFSEPSDLVATLSEAFERGVAFHTADLLRAERIVVEQGIANGTLKVVFATPTLAAGVNFPIRTVIFDEWFRSWNNEKIGVYEYLNMAGRAGRLGFHEEGLAIIKAMDRSQRMVIQQYHRGKLEAVSSQLLMGWKNDDV